MVAMWNKGNPRIHTSDIENVELALRDGLVLIPQTVGVRKRTFWTLLSQIIKQVNSLCLWAQSLKVNDVSAINHAAVSNVCAILNLGNKSIAFGQTECQRLDSLAGLSTNDERSESGGTGGAGVVPTEQARTAESALHGTSRFGRTSEFW